MSASQQEFLFLQQVHRQQHCTTTVLFQSTKRRETCIWYLIRSFATDYLSDMASGECLGDSLVWSAIDSESCLCIVPGWVFGSLHDLGLHALCKSRCAHNASRGRSHNKRLQSL